jgi:hypothetical protein
VFFPVLVQYFDEVCFKQVANRSTSTGFLVFAANVAYALFVEGVLKLVEI